MRQLPPRHLDEHGQRYIYAREAFMAKLYRDGTFWPDETPRWAIGYGHTCSHAEEEKYRGTSLTQGEAATLFRKDTFPRTEILNQQIKVEISQHEYDAVFSLVFNCGTRAFATSSVLSCLNSGDYDGACAHFADWVKWQATPGGPLVKSDGLVLRRTLDQQLFRLQDEDETEFEALIERVKASQLDLTSDLPSLQFGQHMHEQDPNTGGPL
jgi:lysozyme